MGKTQQYERTIESDRPDGMDTPNEQLQNVSTGSNIRTNNLHLNEKENSGEKKAEEEKSSAFSLPNGRLIDSLSKIVNGSNVPFGYTDGKAMFDGRELSDSDIAKLIENIEENINTCNIMIDILNENIIAGKNKAYSEYMLEEIVRDKDNYEKNTAKLFSFLKEIQSEKEKQQTEDKPTVEGKTDKALSANEKPVTFENPKYKKVSAEEYEAVKALAKAENLPIRAKRAENEIIIAFREEDTPKIEQAMQMVTTKIRR